MIILKQIHISCVESREKEGECCVTIQRSILRTKNSFAFFTVSRIVYRQASLPSFDFADLLS